MADEIIALEGKPKSNSYSLLMLFPIATPKQVNGANVVPTPQSELTTLEASLLTAGQKSALDAGTGVFQRTTIQVLENDTGPTLITKAQSKYTALAIQVSDEYDRRYKFTGSKVDAPS